MTERTVSVTLGMKVRGYLTGADQVIAANKRVGTSVRGLTAEMANAAKAGHLDAVADQAGAMGLALTGAFAATIAATAKFEKAMSAVAAATHAPVKEMQALKAAALESGRTTQFSATQAARGITELAKAGVKTRDILGGGLKGALALAAAGQLDVAEAAETAASAMTQFGLKGSDVGHIADLLAAGAGKAQGTVHDLGYALSQSGLVASQMGLSIEETSGALAAFASAGLIGSDAGTSFKTMLLALANPTKESTELMEKLGISAYDAQGNFVGTTKLAGVLQERLAGLTQQQRNAALAQIFGSDAIRAANVLYRQGAKGIQEWNTKVNDQGYAAKTAAKLTDNLIGDVERLKSSLETLAVESGSGASSGLRILTKSANGLVDQFAQMPTAVGSTVTVLAAVGGAALLAGAGWVKMRRSNAEALEELRATGPAGTRAAAGLQATTKWAGRAAGAFAALSVAGAVASNFHDAANATTEFAAALQAIDKGGNAQAAVKSLYGNSLKDVASDIERLQRTGGLAGLKKSVGFEQAIPGVSAVFNALDSSMTNLEVRLKGLDQAFAQVAQAQGPKAAEAAFAAFTTQVGLTVEQAKALRDGLPQFTTALQNVGPASDVAGAGTKNLAGGMNAAAAAADTERAALKGLSDTLRAQSDPVFAVLNAQKALRDSQKAVTDAQKEFGRTSPEAKAALRGLALAALDVEDAAAGLGDSFDGKMTPALRATLSAAGLTAPQIKALETQFRNAKTAADDFEGKYEAKTSAPGARTAKSDLEGAYTAAKGFAGPYQAQVKLVGDEAVGRRLTMLSQMQSALKRGTNLPAPARRAFAFADGGWTGPGGKYEPAGVVHADEYVIRKDSRRKIESKAPGLLDRMNSTGTVPGYAAGGLVWPFPVTAAKTRVPSRSEVSAAVTPTFGGVGAGGTLGFILAAVRSAFPGMPLLSGLRPNSRTLSGRRSLHADNRAGDFPPDRDMAAWWNKNFMARTKEFISPFQEFNILNGRRHKYTGAVWNQHNFAGGNAHNHVAMATGGVIREPVFGVGQSGRTYSFGEGGRPEAVIPMDRGLVNVAGSGAGRGSAMESQDAYITARNAVVSLNEALRDNGRSLSLATAKGRANRSELNAAIRAAQQAAEAKFAETDSVRAANLAYDQTVGSLRRVLVQQKVNASTVRSLMAQLSSRPTYDTGKAGDSASTIAFVKDKMGLVDATSDAANFFTWGKPSFNTNSSTGRDELNALFKFLEQANSAAQSRFAQTGSSKSATALYQQSLGALRGILGKAGMPQRDIDKLLRTYGRITLQPNAAGGVYGFESMNKAMALGPGSTLYGFREPSTGGEAFVPRYGGSQADADRTLSIAAGWRGGRYVPGGATTGAGMSGGRFEGTLVLSDGTFMGRIEGRMEQVVDRAMGALADAHVYATNSN